LSAKSILIVDDDVGMLRRLGAAFAMGQFKVYTATNGEIALRLFTAVRPDVVLIDILMPIREGLETIMAMRKARPEVKIVAMSGGGRIGGYEFLNVAIHLGADDIMTKSFKLADALALVSRTLKPEAHRKAPAVSA
jgi:DNA-binding NtrC family response regulator